MILEDLAMMVQQNFLEFREEMNEFREEVNQKFDQVFVHLERLEQDMKEVKLRLDQKANTLDVKDLRRRVDLLEAKIGLM